MLAYLKTEPKDMALGKVFRSRPDMKNTEKQFMHSPEKSDHWYV